MGLLLMTIAHCKDIDASVTLQSVAPPGQKASVLFYRTSGFLGPEGTEGQSGREMHASCPSPS